MCSVGAAGRPDPAGGCEAGAYPLRSAQGGQGRGPGGEQEEGEGEEEEETIFLGTTANNPSTIRH